MCKKMCKRMLVRWPFADRGRRTKVHLTIEGRRVGGLCRQHGMHGVGSPAPVVPLPSPFLKKEGRMNELHSVIPQFLDSPRRARRGWGGDHGRPNRVAGHPIS